MRMPCKCRDPVRIALIIAIGIISLVVPGACYLSCGNIRRTQERKREVARLTTRFDNALDQAGELERQSRLLEAFALVEKEHQTLSQANVWGTSEIRFKAEDESKRLRKLIDSKMRQGCVEFESKLMTPQQRDSILAERRQREEEKRKETEAARVARQKQEETDGYAWTGDPWYDEYLRDQAALKDHERKVEANEESYEVFEYRWSKGWRVGVIRFLYDSPPSSYSWSGRAWRAGVYYLSLIVYGILLVLQWLYDALIVYLLIRVILTWIWYWLLSLVLGTAGVSTVYVLNKK